MLDVKKIKLFFGNQNKPAVNLDSFCNKQHNPILQVVYLRHKSEVSWVELFLTTKTAFELSMILLLKNILVCDWICGLMWQFFQKMGKSLWRPKNWFLPHRKLSLKNVSMLLFLADMQCQETRLPKGRRCPFIHKKKNGADVGIHINNSELYRSLNSRLFLHNKGEAW